MSIPVKCPKCRAEFRVKDEFAGRTGPCPKCKSPITVPRPEAPVVVHEPDAPKAGDKSAPGGKPTGGPLKIIPIEREEVRFTWSLAALVVGGVIVAFALAYVLRNVWQASILLRLVGMFLVGIPLGFGGYAILRNDELEPFRGTSALARIAGCALIYTALWCAIPLFPNDFLQSALVWIVFGVVSTCLAASFPMLLLEIDYGSGVFHYLLYLGTTILLAYSANVPLPWAGAKF